MNLGGQAAPAAAQRVVYRFVRSPFLPPPEAARVARTAVESIIEASTGRKGHPFLESYDGKKVDVLFSLSAIFSFVFSFRIKGLETTKKEGRNDVSTKD